MTKNNYLIAGAVSGCLAVGFGAFGAHALQGAISSRLLDIYHTSTNYQMNHSLALVFAAILLLQFPSSKALQWSVRFFLIGIILFSGSLYLLVLTGEKWLGAITPVGGLSLMLGWLMLALFAANYAKK